MGKTITNEPRHMNNRETYDLSHFCMTVGKIGSLQTLSLIPVVAGDSIQINMNSVFRLSPLRRNMYLDAVIDQFAFYVPHRHVYGSSWTDFMKAGVNESTTLGTHTMTAPLNCCGTHTVAGTVPSWIPEGYLKIHNNYFKNPTDADFGMDLFDAKTSADGDINYGLSTAHLPRLWNTPVTALTVAADRRIALVDTDKIDLVTFAEKQGSFETLRQREFFARRYRDVMGNAFGSKVNTDQDQRPTLLMHNRSNLTGYDVNGTDDATLGTYTGKGASVAGISVPWKFIPEHGAIWLMATIRFPSVHIAERHYLTGKAEPTYADISGDAELYRTKAPVVLNLTEYFTTATDTDAGLIPFGQWYREQPHYVHNDYGAIEGHPFIETAFTDEAYIKYVDPAEYDNIFSTLQLKHWQSQGHCDCQVKRLIPDPRTSIFAGTT